MAAHAPPPDRVTGSPPGPPGATGRSRFPAPGWRVGAPGVLSLPSGRLVRGRPLRRPPGPGPHPTFAVHLSARPTAAVPWPVRWVRWPDLRTPADTDDALDAARELWWRAPVERVEVACAGGRGRTGTVLATLAVLDGLSAREAVRHVRGGYSRWAVETAGQRRWLARVAAQR